MRSNIERLDRVDALWAIGWLLVNVATIASVLLYCFHLGATPCAL